jgi:hypothetical protein
MSKTSLEIAKELMELEGTPTPYPGDLPDCLQDIFKNYEQNPARTNDNGDSGEESKGSVENPFKSIF